MSEREVRSMKKSMRKSTKGFTLIELMIVVAIIGILAAIAIPKFADLVTKSKESATKGQLGTVRSAVSIYYSDTEGMFPSNGNLAAALTVGGKYLQEIPRASVPRAGGSTTPGEHNPGTNAIDDGDLTVSDGGGWFYNSGAGHVAVACTHTDTKGSVWSTW
jgi:prepilin-type N-terminal cleavage/methylation domain-containing protein